ncbi:MAG: hypothetical protein KDC34_07995 [Saprospiraceae bacterium]|nr:hypothetical protein [Saprospiraceae bacterium]
MYKYVLCLSLLMYALAPVSACDVCGCAPSGTSSGLLEYSYRNYIRTQYQLTRFSQNQPGDRISLDRKHAIQFNASFLIGKKIRVSLDIPYYSTVRYTNSVPSYQTKGIGDSWIKVGWLHRKTFDDNRSFSVEIGSGVQVPLGEHAEAFPDFDETPYWFYPGTGSFALQGYARAVYKHRDFFWNLVYSTTWFLPTNWEYHPGQQLVAGSFFRYQLSPGNWKIFPVVGAQYEHLQADIYEEEAVHGTGGNNWIGSIGIDVNKGRIILGTNIQLPIFQHLGGGAIHQQAGINTNLSIIF